VCVCVSSFVAAGVFVGGRDGHEGNKHTTCSTANKILLYTRAISPPLHTQACTDSDASLADGQIFEAFPTDTCVAQRQSDGNFFSLEFGKDDFENPLVTYIFGSTDCGASNAKAKTSSTELYTACADQAWQGGISVYGKWVYHP
jgi:hypothetical protein